MKITRWLSLWMPVLVCAAAIFVLSHQPDVRTVGSELPELMLRKLAHLIEYGVLAFLLARALSGHGWAPKKIAGVGFLLCLLYAASDEFHQSFVPGRYGKVRDVVLDSLGAAMVLSVYARFQVSRIMKKTKTPA